MTPRPPSSIEDEAVGWFVALNGGDAAEADYVAFRDWLEASPEHVSVYARVEQTWVALDEVAAETKAPVRLRNSAPAPRLAWIGGGIAAALAVVLVAPQFMPGQLQTYQTAHGERRDVILSDGSHIFLNSASTTQVRMKHGLRQVALTSGEAQFDVVHDANRPFEVQAGATTIRDVGTVFNVRRDDDQLTVTVLRGAVSVAGSDAPTLQLTRGDQVRIGANGRVQAKLDDPDSVSDWRTGRLVYHDQALADVVADLNRYLPKPLVVDPSVAGMRFSGVLQLDTQDAMVRRLEGLMSIRAVSTADGVRLTGRK